jgi:hypothetical protein
MAFSILELIRHSFRVVDLTSKLWIRDSGYSLESRIQPLDPKNLHNF